MRIETEITTSSYDVPDDNGPDEYITQYLARLTGLTGNTGFTTGFDGIMVETTGTPAVAVRVSEHGTTEVWTGAFPIYVGQAITEDVARTIIRDMVDAYSEAGWVDWEIAGQWAVDLIQVHVFDVLGRNLSVGYGEDIWSTGPAGEMLADYQRCIVDHEDEMRLSM